MSLPSLLILILVTIPFFYDYALAETECSQVCIAKQFYTQGEAVIISGKVDAYLPDTPLLIQVFRDTNRVHIAQVVVAKDGTYSYSMIADGPYFKTDGKYVVQASYGVMGNVFETSFDFQTTTSGLNPSEIFEVEAGDYGTFDLPYTINGGKLESAIIDPNILGLILTIQADNDGSITLDLGRKWIDAKKGPDGKSGDDEKYLIYLDGSEVTYQESTIKSESRLITIKFQEGNSKIDIIGTYVVPEFGSMAVLVLVIAASSVLVLSKKHLRKFN